MKPQLDQIPTPRSGDARAARPSRRLRATLAASLFAATAPLALGSALAAATTVECASATAAADRHVVVLKDGRIARGPAEALPEGGYRVRNKDGQWAEFTAEQVERAAPERELLASLAKERAREDVAPAELLEWPIERGLLGEAFALADDLLEEHPRDPDLLTVAARLGKFALPKDASSADLIAFAAGGGRAVREAALVALVRSGERDALLAALRADVRSKTPSRRGFALFALGRLFPGEDARVPLLHAMYDSNEAVRKDAARSIGDIGALEVGRPLVDALWSDSPKVRMRAAEALGEVRDPAFAEPLLDRYFALHPPREPKPAITRPPAARAGAGGGSGGPVRAYIFVGRQRAYIQDFNVEVAQFASVADPVINVLTEGAVLDVGVVGVTDVTTIQEGRIVLRGLQRTTRLPFGNQPNRWRKWWSSDESKPYRPH